jgi:hypothetical protein
MAFASQCPSFLWIKLINIANYLININPTRSNNGTTPDQVYYKTKPKVDHLRIFGSLYYLHIPKESRSKLDSKTRRCFFLGYDEQSKAFYVYDPIYRKLHISRNIVFDEQTIGYNFIQQNAPSQIEPILFPEPNTPDSNFSNPILSEPLEPNSPNPTPANPPSPIPIPDLPNPNQSEPLDTP